tara:strand:- start:99 stop:1346 length:1248 start_codon:yes stop_codon:yes gene_type:complete
MEKYNSLKDWKKANLKEYNKAYGKNMIDDICEAMGWYYKNTKRKTSFSSDYEYSELIKLAEGNKKLIKYIKKLFDDNTYIKVFDFKDKWDIVKDKLYLQNINKKTYNKRQYPCIDNDGWETITLPDESFVDIEDTTIDHPTGNKNNLLLNNDKRMIIINDKSLAFELHPYLLRDTTLDVFGKTILLVDNENRDTEVSKSWGYKNVNPEDVKIRLIDDLYDKLKEYQTEEYFYDYNFSYRFKNYTARVHNSFGDNQGTPHKEILDQSIKIIHKHLGIDEGYRYHSSWVIANKNYNDLSYEIEKEIPDNGYYDTNKEIDNNIITELVSEGGFNQGYYVKHNVSRIDIEDVMNTYQNDTNGKASLSQLKLRNNIYNLLRVTKNHHLMDDEMKELFESEVERKNNEIKYGFRAGKMCRV